MASLISIIIPAKNPPEEILEKVSHLVSFLKNHFANQWEIILAFNGDPEHCQKAAEKIDRSFSQEPVQVVKVLAVSGKGLGVRTAYEQCRGDYISYMDWDLPYDLSFLLEGMSLLKKGADFVSANRRIRFSRFDILQEQFGRAYLRHKLGTLFNWGTRHIFGLKTKDTQAGAKLMTRAVANAFFMRMTNLGFLFDIELFLVAKYGNFQHKELPVVVQVGNEKSTIHFVGEAFRTLRSIYQIKRNDWYGWYKPTTDKAVLHPTFLFTADDWGISKGVNDGILNLAKLGVIKRVSMMANMDFLDYRLDELLALPGVDFGCHFNLTLGLPTAKDSKHLIGTDGCFLPLKKQIQKAFFPPDKEGFQEAIRQELKSQLSILKNKRVKLSYIDGHHHIHLLPPLAKLWVTELSREPGLHTRLVLDPRLVFSKNFILYVWSFWLKRHLKNSSIKALPCIYPKLAKTTLASLKNRVGNIPTEIICHPAMEADLLTIRYPDAYNFERVREYWALIRAAGDSPYPLLTSDVRR
mgnify:CR=1 FL=1